jgi:glucokinase
MSQYIGIDIGGSTTCGGLVNNSGTVVVRKDHPTPARLGGEQVLQESIALAAYLMKSTDKKIKAIGIGAGGQIDTNKGIVLSATDVLPEWQGINIAEAFTKQLGVQTYVENDVNARALGEVRFGASSSMRNNTTVFLLLDAGVGGAILLDGLVHHGAHWSGGEFGQILLTMDANARRGPGGGIGTLEAYCSTSGLLQTWRELSGNDKLEASVREIFIEAQSDPTNAAAAAITKTGEYLGYGLVSIANSLHPHLIIIGGELAKLGDTLLNPAKKVLTARSKMGSVSCAVAETNLGPDAAIIGAASLAMLKTDLIDAPNTTLIARR